jgi:phosphatidylglycerol---prolipoprotein diacylglyceryl transferase
MRPVLFQIGPFPVSSFGVFLLLAFAVGIVVLRIRTRRLGWDGGEVIDLSLYAIIGGVIGARIAYVLVNIGEFIGDPARVFTIWKDAGLAFYGALIGGAIVAWLYGRRRGWTLGAIADAGAPGLALGYAVAMVGTLLYGLNYGRPASVPWAVLLFGEPRHPTQIYLMIAALIIFVVLLVTERRPHASGYEFWLFLFLYAAARSIVEFYMDSPHVLGPLTLAQCVNIPVAVIAAWLMLSRRSPERSVGEDAMRSTPPSAVAPPPEAIEPHD